MITWEERQASEIAKAKADLSARKDASSLVAATLNWVSETQSGNRSRRDSFLAHEATPSLSAKLTEAGILASGELESLLGHHEGPIAPGCWLFAQLIGRAGAQYTTSSLHESKWHVANMCGFGSYGAWEAYRAELLGILRNDSDAEKALWCVVEALVKKTAEFPNQSCHVQHGAEEWVSEQVKAYQSKPDLEEAWETRLDSYVLCENSLISWLGMNLNSQKFMDIASRLPHPAFFNIGRNGEEVRAQGVVADLIRRAPLAFEADGRFMHGGMVVARLLTMAGEYIRQCGGNGRVYPAPIKPEDQSALQAEVEAARCAAIEVLDALFSRADAKRLAWAWLERLIREGEHRGYWRTGNAQERGATTNSLYLLIAELSGRIEVSDIPPEHPETTPWKPIFGPMAALAVLGLREKPDIETLQRRVWQVLTVDRPEFHIGSGGEFFRGAERPIGLIGAVCLLQMPEPGSFLKQCWHRLRPHRERSWRVDENSRSTPNPGMPLILWGVTLLSFVPEEERSGLLESLPELLKDAWQTDARFSIHYQFWPDALEVFSIQWARNGANQEKPTTQQISAFLLPYLNGEYVLMRVISALRQGGIDLLAISQAVHELGEELPELAHEFLSTHQYLISKNHWNRDWISEIRVFASGGETSP